MDEFERCWGWLEASLNEFGAGCSLLQMGRQVY
jgi:hypothetical protein